jgi:hypothetical protein
MNDFWMQLQPILVDLLIVVIGTATTYFINWLSKKKAQAIAQTNNTVVSSAMNQAEKVIDDCVKTVSQTYVDDLKKAGTFTKDNQANAYEKCKDAVMAVLSADTIAAIKTVVTDFETWLRTKIEASVSDNK